MFGKLLKIITKRKINFQKVQKPPMFNEWKKYRNLKFKFFFSKLFLYC